jgi:hypothetical protein
MAEKPLYSDKDKALVAQRMTTQRINKEVHIKIGSGEMSLEIPGLDALGTLIIHLNNRKTYLALMVNEELHFAKIRAGILRAIIYRVEHLIETGFNTRKSLESAGYAALFKQLSRHQALAYRYNPDFNHDFMRINRAELIEMAQIIVDIITLHDIQEDEAQSEPEENTNA